MKARLLLPACVVVALTASCVAERRPGPAPTQAPRPVASAPPAVKPVAPPATWRQVALTAGDWSYTAEPGGSAARFGPGTGQALLMLRCDRAAAAVTLTRAGAAAAPVSLAITTDDGTRPFSAAPQGQPPSALAVGFAATDPFLDSLAFSRGRFAVETAGLPPLYLPAWSEIGRVVEDCR